MSFSQTGSHIIIIIILYTHKIKLRYRDKNTGMSHGMLLCLLQTPQDWVTCHYKLYNVSNVHTQEAWPALHYAAPSLANNSTLHHLLYWIVLLLYSSNDALSTLEAAAARNKHSVPHLCLFNVTLCVPLNRIRLRLAVERAQ